MAPTPAGVVERAYSQGAYPHVQRAVTAVSNLTAVSLFDILMLGLVTAMVVLWWRRLARAARGARWRALAMVLLTTLAAASVLYLWFLAVWGFNYRRERLATRLGLDESRISETALATLGGAAADRLNGLADGAGRWPDLAGMQSFLSPAFDTAVRGLGRGDVRLSRPKRSLLAPYFRRAAVDGMTAPFFLETLVRHDLLPFERPAVVAHEWAHLAGYADEAEASFVGWLACMHGPPAARYSGWMFLYLQVAKDLPRETRRALDERLGAKPRADLRALAEKYERETSRVAREAGRRVYDRFLKANRLESGIRSYDEVTRLILGTGYWEKY